MEGAHSNTDLVNTKEGEEAKKDFCHDCESITRNAETCQKTLCNCENVMAKDSPEHATDSNDDDAEDDDAVTVSSSTVPKIHGKSLIHGKRINAKLRTSKDVYDRLKWDSESIIISSFDKELDISSIYIGYKDRFLGMCELALEEYNPGGDIPFHRIYYFRTGGPPVLPFIGKDGEVKVREDNLPEGAVFIWDRESRTDLVFKSGNSTVNSINK